MSKPVVLFFARGYQSDFFPFLESDAYESIFVTLTKGERLRVEHHGKQVVGCFEENYDSLRGRPIVEDYLITSFMSDRFLGRYSYLKRLEILGKEAAFWDGILNKYAPSVVVNELVAIEISEVLLIECRSRKVRYLAGMNCLVDDYFYWLRNPMSLSGEYLERTSPGPAAVTLAQKYVEEILEKNYKPFYVRNLNSRRDLTPLVVAFVKLVIWGAKSLVSAGLNCFRYEMYVDEYGKRLVVYFKGLIHRYDTIADLPAGKEVIYYPLHQEPEATLNYMSEFYANQAATLENILKCLSVNQVLVVKEHPVDKGSLLRGKFWRLKKQCSGLYYFPSELNGRDVIAAAHRIVTLTSTVGWEAAVLGKKVYVLGKIFYDCFEGITAVGNFDDLRRELRALTAGKTVALPDVRDFVARMVEQSRPGNPFPHALLFSEPNLRRVIDSIVAELPPQKGG